MTCATAGCTQRGTYTWGAREFCRDCWHGYTPGHPARGVPA